MLPPQVYQQARDGARFHAQVELVRTGGAERTPCVAPVEARVVCVFRGGGALSAGDHVWFRVPVARREDQIPVGGAIFIDYSRFKTAGYMEVFLNGEPPDCRVALDQCLMLDAPTNKSHFDSPARETAPTEVTRRNWWEFWR